MTKTTFIYFSVFYIMQFIALDIIYFIGFYSFFTDSDDSIMGEEERFEKRIFPQCLLILGITDFVIWLLYRFVGFIGEFTKMQRAYWWQFVFSNYGVLLMLIDFAIIVIASFVILSTKGWLTDYKINKAEAREENIKKCIGDLEEEIKDVRKAIKDTENDKTKEMYQATLDDLEEHLYTYRDLENSNRIYLTELGLKKKLP